MIGVLRSLLKFIDELLIATDLKRISRIQIGAIFWTTAFLVGLATLLLKRLRLIRPTYS